MSHKLRSRFERDLEDSLLFLRELILVFWRLNPAGIAAYRCRELFESVSDSTPNDQKAAWVEEVVTSIEIGSVSEFENEMTNGIRAICSGATSEVIASAAKEHPKIESYLRESFGDEDRRLGESFTRMTTSAIQRQRHHYEELHSCYIQLAEHLPRYTSIMRRTGIFDNIMVFAAGFFGGVVGVAGAEAWENWRNSSDHEFFQKFGNAFEQFAQSCHDYTSQGEEALSIVYERLFSEVRRLHHRLFDCYEQLADAGWDIIPLYRSYLGLDEPLDDEDRVLFELAINNLEEDPSMHYRSIENIRIIVGLDNNSGRSSFDDDLATPPTTQPRIVPPPPPD